MLFTSYTFFVFLAVVVGLYYVLPWRTTRWLLILASYFFYGAAEPWYCLLLLSSTLVDFIAAQAIAGSQQQRTRRGFLIASILLNLGLLGTFKYADFGISNLNVVMGWLGVAPLPLLEWLLPVGISFYTFQTLSYTIDVYRGKMAPTRDFAAFALYVAYFPQLVAGPIERAHRLLPQFTTRPVVTMLDIEEGFQRILWGLIKKNVFADRFSLMVNPVFAAPSFYNAPELIIATMCFSFQLYLDFSAYTDIAIGIGRLMGIRLSENFNYPFLARTPSEFWARWHMTLTTWFRDYVFNSLGGVRRHHLLWTSCAVVLTMSLVGLWHGAAWHFIMFGLLSGLTIVGYSALRLFTPWGKRGPLLGNYWWSPLAAVVIGNVVINCLMVFFRAPDLYKAGAMFYGMATGQWTWSGRFDLQLVMLVLVWALHVYRGLGGSREWLRTMAAPWRGMAWLGMILLLLYGTVDQTERFIYFQF